jgi:hypothetical protein
MEWRMGDGFGVQRWKAGMILTKSQESHQVWHRVFVVPIDQSLTTMTDSI